MIMKKLIYIFLAVTLVLTGCRPGHEGGYKATFDGFTQGTYYHVVTISRDSLNLEGPIDSLFTVIDNSMSIFNPSSLLSRLNRNETDSLDPYITHCIATARKVSELSGGLYDITVKPLVEAWGFAAREQDAEPNLDSLVQFVGYDKISIADGRLVKADPRVQLDLNSIAKGYSADLVARLVESYGVKDYLVEIGGEIVAKGRNASDEAWKIGIDKPVEGNFMPGAQTQVVVAVSNKCIATSGNYRNYRYDDLGRRIVHTINPRTGSSSPGNVLSATVFADDCATADAMGTALMVVGFDKAVKMLEATPGVWGYLIYSDAKGDLVTYASPQVEKIIVQ